MGNFLSASGFSVLLIFSANLLDAAGSLESFPPLVRVMVHQSSPLNPLIDICAVHVYEYVWPKSVIASDPFAIRNPFDCRMSSTNTLRSVTPVISRMGGLRYSNICFMRFIGSGVLVVLIMMLRVVREIASVLC